MTRNIGSVDRILRAILGLGLISLYFTGPQTPWGLLGIVPLLTAFVSFCPAYRLIGISTCSRRVTQ